MHGAHPRASLLALQMLERLVLPVFAGEGLRGLHTGDRLVNERVHVALLVRQILVCLALEMLQHAHHHDE